jgi:hypothetical protein
MEVYGLASEGQESLQGGLFANLLLGGVTSRIRREHRKNVNLAWLADPSEAWTLILTKYSWCCRNLIVWSIQPSHAYNDL